MWARLFEKLYFVRATPNTEKKLIFNQLRTLSHKEKADVPVQDINKITHSSQALCYDTVASGKLPPTAFTGLYEKKGGNDFVNCDKVRKAARMRNTNAFWTMQERPYVNKHMFLQILDS